MAIRYVLKFEVTDVGEGRVLYSDEGVLLTQRLGALDDREIMDVLMRSLRPNLVPDGETAGELAALLPVERQVRLPQGEPCE